MPDVILMPSANRDQLSFDNRSQSAPSLLKFYALIRLIRHDAKVAIAMQPRMHYWWLEFLPLIYRQVFSNTTQLLPKN